MNEELLKLCPKCWESSSKRFHDALTHNQDRDADWWKTWWDKELKKQDHQLRTCCDKYEVV